MSPPKQIGILPIFLSFSTVNAFSISISWSLLSQAGRLFDSPRHGHCLMLSLTPQKISYFRIHSLDDINLPCFLTIWSNFIAEIHSLVSGMLGAHSSHCNRFLKPNAGRVCLLWLQFAIRCCTEGLRLWLLQFLLCFSLAIMKDGTSFTHEGLLVWNTKTLSKHMHTHSCTCTHKLLHEYVYILTPNKCWHNTLQKQQNINPLYSYDRNINQYY